VNHCSFWLEGSWGHCCQAHDAAYDALAPSGGSRLAADLDLAWCVAQTGNPVMAALMFTAVAAFGWLFVRRPK
jgi:hypothetical protein